MPYASPVLYASHISSGANPWVIGLRTSPVHLGTVATTAPASLRSGRIALPTTELRSESAYCTGPVIPPAAHDGCIAEATSVSTRRASPPTAEPASPVVGHSPVRHASQRYRPPTLTGVKASGTAHDAASAIHTGRSGCVSAVRKTPLNPSEMSHAPTDTATPVILHIPCIVSPPPPSPAGGAPATIVL